MPSTRLVLAALIITLLTITGILNSLYMTQASLLSHSWPQTPSQAVGGRWQFVQTSLGMKPLPDTLIMSSYPATSRPRIDFRRRKRTVLPSLHFAHDALFEQKVSLKELVVSFRRIAHEETKAESPRPEAKKGRGRLGRSILRKGHITTSR